MAWIFSQEPASKEDLKGKATLAKPDTHTAH